ncbi:TMEM175 family protein [Lysinibacter sp. HNR]|uniref:TMEM175 family protein n=1 Tax=Lysinibacter sp. HNR TaxID=3031408 RepID=UPI002434B07F|nr:TMEM175 family protein [Lysinibacter sp. HNR]WGD38454.1 TMEM175 family protein [Lysinibacter sp. HNR]
MSSEAPPPPSQEYQTERGLGRITGFSDAVVAIAITLLVLPLIDVAKESTSTDFTFLFREKWYSFFAFILSFVVVGWFWRFHHSFYEHVVGYNQKLILTNLLWLLTIVFLPFPTAVLADSNAQNPLAIGLYIGTVALTSFAELLQTYIVRSNPELSASGTGKEFRLTSGIITTIILIVAGIIGVLFPHIGVLALLLLVVEGYIRRLLRILKLRKKQRRKAILDESDE